MGCFLVLFVQVNLLQVAQTSCPGLVAAYDRSGCQQHLNNDPRNVRAITRDFSQTRGTVTSADGVVLAKSVPSNDRYKYQRVFPTGSLFGQITGSFSFTVRGLGRGARVQRRAVGPHRHPAAPHASPTCSWPATTPATSRSRCATTSRPPPARPSATSTGRRWSLDPKTGAILAMWSNPSYDPNPLSHHDTPGNPVAKAPARRPAQRPR